MQNFINSVRNFLSENSNKDKTVVSSETTNLTESENLKKMHDEAEKTSAAANAIKHTFANHKQAAALHDKAFDAHNKLYTHYKSDFSSKDSKKLSDYHDEKQRYHLNHSDGASFSLKQHNASLSSAKRAKTSQLKKDYTTQAKMHMANFNKNTITHGHE